jgi:hypothetical protein
LARTQWRKLCLDSAASTLGASAAERETTATYRAFGKSITSLTQPLDEETEITGPLAARLWASATTSDADLFLVVRISTEQGKEKLSMVFRTRAFHSRQAGCVLRSANSTLRSLCHVGPFSATAT